MTMAPCKGPNKCVCKESVIERFKHFLPILQRIPGANNTELQEIIKCASPCFIRLISELGLNILKGSVKLPRHQYKKLRPHKRLLVHLSKPGFSASQHRSKLLKKKGGFLPAVLPFLLTALSGFAGQALAKTLL